MSKPNFLRDELTELAKEMNEVTHLVIQFAPETNEGFQLEEFRDAVKKLSQARLQLESMADRYCGVEGEAAE